MLSHSSEIAENVRDDLESMIVRCERVRKNATYSEDF